MLSARLTTHHYRLSLIDGDFVKNLPYYPRTKTLHFDNCVFDEKNLRILEHYPSLEVLYVSCRHSIRLSGIENCSRLRHIDIKTDGCSKIESVDGLEFCDLLQRFTFTNMSRPLEDQVKSWHPRAILVRSNRVLKSVLP